MTRIDVHAHFVPPFYRDALMAAGRDHPDGIPAIPEWSEESALRLMDQLEIETAVLSISSPGVHFGDADAAVVLARRCNEEGHRLKQRHGGRFGYFACLPLPEVESSISEAVRAIDELDADGVVIQSNHWGVYLGNPVLEPLFAELDHRGAVVFLHPASPHCSSSGPGVDYPAPLLEFMFDTTRSVADLILSGRLERFPDLPIIVPHAGAALSVLAARIDLLAPVILTGERTAPSVTEALRRLYFDVAGAPVPVLLTALQQLADPAHLLYGSDFPFTPANVVGRLAAAVDTTDAIGDDARIDLLSGNARRLLHRLGPRPH